MRNEQHISLSFKVLPELPAPPDKRLRGNVGFNVGLRGEASDLGAQLHFRCARSSSVTGKRAASVVETEFRYSPAGRGKVSYKGNMQLLNETSYRLAKQLSCLESSRLSRKLQA
ncbi:hypothetical protein [Streptomyces sp. NPDC054834]